MRAEDEGAEEVEDRVAVLVELGGRAGCARGCVSACGGRGGGGRTAGVDHDEHGGGELDELGFEGPVVVVHLLVCSEDEDGPDPAVDAGVRELGHVLAVVLEEHEEDDPEVGDDVLPVDDAGGDAAEGRAALLELVGEVLAEEGAEAALGCGDVEAMATYLGEHVVVGLLGGAEDGEVHGPAGAEEGGEVRAGLDDDLGDDLVGQSEEEAGEGHWEGGRRGRTRPQRYIYRVGGLLGCPKRSCH